MSRSTRAPKVTPTEQYRLLADAIASVLDSGEYPDVAGADGSITSDAIYPCVAAFLESATEIQSDINRTAVRNADKSVAHINVVSHIPGKRYDCKAEFCPGDVGTPDFTCSKCGQRHELFVRFTG